MLIKLPEQPEHVTVCSKNILPMVHKLSPLTVNAGTVKHRGLPQPS